MPVVWEYTGTIDILASLPTPIKDEWEATLKAEQTRIYNALTTKIPDETSFKNKIATPSSDQFSAFLASTGGAWDADTIKLKQRVKLARAYSKWNTGIEGVFGSGGTFGDTVTAKKDRLEALRYVISGVGNRSQDIAWEPISNAVLLLRGDKRPITYFDSNDAWTAGSADTHESCLDPVKGRLITPSLIAELVRGAIMAIYANEAGDTTTRDNIINTTNSRLDDIITVGLDETHSQSGYVVYVHLAWDTGNDLAQVIAHDEHPT